MLVNSKEMVGVPVETHSGQSVGKVASFDLEAETGRLLTLRVKTRGFLPGFLTDELLVAWSAVIEMLPDRVLVSDGSVRQGAAADLPSSAPVPAAPSMMSVANGSVFGGKES